MKKLLLLFFITHSIYATTPLEEYLQPYHLTPSQEVGVKVVSAIAFWGTLVVSSELLYYLGLGLRKVNHAIIHHSIHSIKEAWHIVIDEPAVVDGEKISNSKIIATAKVIGYIGLASLPIGVCYLAIL